MPCRSEAATMTVRDIIKQEVEKLPESARSEVLDFIQFLEQKQAMRDHLLTAQRISEWSFE
jgi:hypothetical protein